MVEINTNETVEKIEIKKQRKIIEQIGNGIQKIFGGIELDNSNKTVEISNISNLINLLERFEFSDINTQEAEDDYIESSENEEGLDKIIESYKKNIYTLQKGIKKIILYYDSNISRSHVSEISRNCEQVVEKKDLNTKLMAIIFDYLQEYLRKNENKEKIIIAEKDIIAGCGEKKENNISLGQKLVEYRLGKIADEEIRDNVSKKNIPIDKDTLLSTKKFFK